LRRKFRASQANEMEHSMTAEIRPDAMEIARRYIACWNETDGERRRALLAQHWDAAASYRDPLLAGSGLVEIDHLIAAVQARFAGHSFTLKMPVDGYGDRLRFSWSLGRNGEAGAKPAAAGTDFARLDDRGRFVSVTGFLDHPVA
jgi:hypothetical protein